MYMKIFKQRNRFFYLIAAFIISGLLVTSCVDDGEEYTYVVYSAYMQGNLTATIHDYSVKGSTVFLKASGISNFTDDNISYAWKITDTSTHNLWGQTIKYTFPEEDIKVTLFFAAEAYDVYGISAEKSTNLIDGTFSEAVQFPTGTIASDTFIDTRDNQTYQYRTIGSHDWMTQNLNWAGPNANSPIGKTYKNESEYGILYGRLYSWNEATSTTNAVCPTGWHLPTNAEWEDLGQELTGEAVTFENQWNNAGRNASANANIKGVNMWIYSPDNTKVNTHGWNALPAGKVTGNGTSVISNDSGRYGYWWSATEHTAATAHYRYIMYNNARFYPNYGDKTGQYLSIRCVRD